MFVGPVAAFTVISAADGARLDGVRNGLELVVSSFLPPSVARGDHLMLPQQQAMPASPTNPLDAAPADPDRDAPSGNPLDRGAPPFVDPFVGRFADPDVTLMLEPAGGGYAGEMVVLGARYPVSATRVDGRLDGSFGVGEQRFAFIAALDGDVLTLESDGARFVLQRRP